MNTEICFNEHWKKLEEFPNYYISDTGEIYSCKYNRLLKPAINKSGYVQTMLCNDGKYINILVHRLVAEAFIPKTDEDIQLNRTSVDHINGIRDDNRAENLRWCTQQENCAFELSRQHRSERQKGKTLTEAHKQKLREAKLGDKNPNWGTHKSDAAKQKSRQSNPNKKCVLQYTKSGEFVAEYVSLHQAAEVVGGNPTLISNCCKGLGKTHCGYIWKFKED